jgi:hypothetical protein
MKIVDDDRYWEAAEQEHALIDQVQRRISGLPNGLAGVAMMSAAFAVVAMFTPPSRSMVVVVAAGICGITAFASFHLKRAYEASLEYPVVPPMRDSNDQAVPSVVFRHMSNAFIERSAEQAVAHVANGDDASVAYHNDNIAEYFKWLDETSEHAALTVASYVARVRAHYRAAAGQDPYNPVIESDAAFIDAVFDSLSPTLSLAMDSGQVAGLLKAARREFDDRWA